MPDAEFRPPAPQPVGGPQDVTLQDPPLREGPWPGEDDATAGIRIAPRILLVSSDPEESQQHIASLRRAGAMPGPESVTVTTASPRSRRRSILSPGAHGST